MQFPEFRWVDFAAGGVNHRNNIVEIREAVGSIRAGRNTLEAYITVFRFPDAYRSHAQEFKSVKGYAGTGYADYLPIDVDRAGDLPGALASTRRLAQVIHSQFELWPDQCRYFFSGSKGFHLMVPLALFGAEPSEKLAGALRRIATDVGAMAGEKIDDKIYDLNRLFRLPNSQHRSGLWKIELSWEEISTLTAEQITAKATGPRKFEWEPRDTEERAGLREVLENALRDSGGKRAAPVGGDRLENVVKILSPFYASPNRHALMLAFAGYAAKASIPREEILGVAERLGTDRDELRNLTGAVNDSFDRIRSGAPAEGYRGLSKILTAEALGELSLVIEGTRQTKHAEPEQQEQRISHEHVYDSTRAGQAYREYVRKLTERRIGTGIPTIDRLTRGLMPGTVTMFLAKARVGKSLFAQNLRRHISRTVPSGMSIFFSLEMPIEIVWERDAQHVLGMSGHEVEKRLRFGGDDETDGIIATVAETTRNAYTVTAAPLSLDEIEKYCAMIQADVPARALSCVLIDYLSLVSSSGRDLYTATSMVARGLKPLAKRLGVPVVMLAQVRRQQSGGAKSDGTSAPSLEDGRDSGGIEEGADFVIGAYRPRLDDEALDDEICLKLLKNRLGKSGVDVRCRVNWRTLEIHELETIEEIRS